MTPERVEVLGSPVDCVNMVQALGVVDRMMQGDRPQTIIAVNPEKIIKAQSDKNLCQFLNNSGLLIPDGIGVVVAVRLLCGKKLSRVPGAELMPEICRHSVGKGYRLYLLGAGKEVNVKAISVLREKYPGINIVGSRDGYFTESDMPEIISDINNSGADILFVALGSPRQELWMEKYLTMTNVKVCQGVGGTFDVLAGNIKRAPAMFRRMNLEWFYRLASQPKRVLRQTALPRFAYQLLITKFMRLRFW